MVTLREAAQQALEALGHASWDAEWKELAASETARTLRQAIESEQQDEPVRVATVTGVDECGPMLNWHKPWVDMVGKHIYDGPQPAQQPLTDEQIERAWSLHADTAEAGKRRVAFARAIERAHGIK